MSESAENLDGLMMGEGSEGASESDEVFSERLKVAQAKIAAIKKDEKKSKSFDDKLARIISTVHPNHLDLVILLINHEIPSLTILAFISLINDEAGKICFIEFDKFIEEKADFSLVKFEDPKIEEKISYWWTFIFAADHTSTTTKLNSLRTNETFVKTLSKELADLILYLLQQHQELEFDRQQLIKMLEKYEKMMFKNEEKN